MKSNRTGSGGSPFVDLPGKGFAEDEIELGYVSGFFGVQGELRLFLFNPKSEALAKGAKVVLLRPDGSRVGARLRARTGAGKRVIGRFEGVTDRNFAETLMDWRIGIRRSDLPAAGKDEFYVADVVGLAAVVAGKPIGTILGVQTTPGGDLLEIDLGEESLFVPVIGQFILEVDVPGGKVVISEEALDDDGEEQGDDEEEE